MRKENTVKLLLIPLLCLILAGCTATKNNNNIETSQNSSTNNSGTGSIKLEADPMEACNMLSESQRILINYPCENQEIDMVGMNVKGKIINVDEEVKAKIIQDGEVLYTKDIFPVPQTAAGEFKLIDEEIDIGETLQGDAILQIEQGGDAVEIPIKL
ncbi:hypothetical protein GF362_00510 [Candidatus Dojkabacteria bacterium]|nr:hypothetical protein [Candidatus Dojkabacteria bacterium]